MCSLFKLPFDPLICVPLVLPSNYSFIFIFCAYNKEMFHSHQLGRLDVFQNAQCVKVNPDSPQKQVRFLTHSGESAATSPCIP